MTPTIKHSAEGTLVHDTNPGDRNTIDVLKANGFRWSPRLEAWYLPRNLRPETRDVKVCAVTESLGDGIRVETPDGERGQSAAERDAARRERAADRADRMTARAERKHGEAEAAHDAARQATAGIPLGQPILVGHHSQRRHERALERTRLLMDKSLAAERQADRARVAAERATRTATGEESAITIDNRINRNQAELRRVVRSLATTASPEHADQLLNRREQLADQIGFDKQKLAAAGGITYGKHNVHVGDLINATGRWLPVVRANAKTATVPTGYSWTDTLPWSKVRGVVKAEDFTPGQVQQMLDTAGDDKHRSAALAKTLERAEQAATHRPGEDTTTARVTPAPGETDELPLDLAADVDAERASQRVHQQQRTGHPPTGAAASTAGARGWAR